MRSWHTSVSLPTPHRFRMPPSQACPGQPQAACGCFPTGVVHSTRRRRAAAGVAEEPQSLNPLPRTMQSRDPDDPVLHRTQDGARLLSELSRAEVSQLRLML